MVAESFLTFLGSTGPSGGPGTSHNVTLQVPVSVLFCPLQPTYISQCFFSYSQ